MGVNRTVSLSEAIEDYIRFRRSQDYSKTTIRQDESTLRQFMGVTGNIWVHAISTNHVTRFFEEGAKTRQPQTQRNDHTRLSVFFDWARETGRMSRDNNPLYGRRKPKQLRKERNRVPVAKFAALLDAAEQRDPRDRVAMALLLYTLGRDGEISGIRMRDLDLDSGYIHVIVHKTREEDRVPICAELDAELRRWLTHYTAEVGYLEPNYFVIPARKTRPVYEAGLLVRHEAICYRPDKEVPELGKIAVPALRGIGFPVVDAQGRRCGEGAHTIRRSGARALFDTLVDGGYDQALRIVQSLLHHSSMKTTEIYVGITADKRTRDEILRGQAMYDFGGNVADIRRRSAQ